MIARCPRCAEKHLKKCGCVRRRSEKIKAHLRAIAMKGSLAARAEIRRQSLARWQQEIGSMSKVEIAKAFHLRGYKQGWMAANGTAYARGFEACVKTWIEGGDERQKEFRRERLH